MGKNRNLILKFYNGLGTNSKTKYIKLSDDSEISDYISEIGLPEYLRVGKAVAVPTFVIKPKSPLLKITISSNKILIENQYEYSFEFRNTTKFEKTISLRYFSEATNIEDNFSFKIFKINENLLIKWVFKVLQFIYVPIAFFVLFLSFTQTSIVSIAIGGFSIPITFVLGLIVFHKRIINLFKTKSILPKNNENLIETIVDSKLSCRIIQPRKENSIVKQLIQKQKKEIANKLLLTRFNGPINITYDSLFPDIYLSCPVSTYKSYSNKEIYVEDWMKNNFENHDNIFFLGDAGYGKTTTAIKIYLDFANKFLNEETTPVPIFIDIKNIEIDIRDFHSLISNVFELNSILDYKDKIHDFMIEDFIFIIDGIDEILLKDDPNHVVKVKKHFLFSNCWNISNSRIDFFDKYLKEDHFVNAYSEIFVFKTWDYESLGKILINNYFEKNNLANEINSFFEYLSSNNLEKYFDTPLKLTMSIFIWLNSYDSNEKMIQKKITNISNFYHDFFSMWIKRELKHKSLDFIDCDIVLYNYCMISYYLYSANNINIQAQLSKLITKQSIIDNKTAHYLTDIDNYNLFKKENNSFIHASFYEWLVSKAIIILLNDSNAEFESVLALETTVAITTFTRFSFMDMNEKELDLRSDLLYETYYKYLNNKSLKSIYIRKNACYFLSRINTSKSINYILNILNAIDKNEIKETSFVIGTLLSGFITLDGYYDLENRYLAKLEDNSLLDIRNRKYHLAYYGDIIVNSLTDYEIDCIKKEDDWLKTRNVLLKRLKSKNERDQKLRTLDLITIRRFLETRRKTNLTLEEYKAIWFVQKKYKNLIDEKEKIIIRERKKLRQVVFLQFIKQLSRFELKR